MADYAEILSRYKRLRSVSKELNNGVMKHVSGEDIQAAARKLGLWVNGTVVFDHEDQSDMLMDHAIHGCFRGRRNAVDRYIAAHPPVPGSDEETVLRATQQSFFSLFVFKGIERGVGVHVLDLLEDRRYFLADVALSGCYVKGGIMATRVIPFDGFLMTTGAGVPVDPDVLREVFDCLTALDKAWRDKPCLTRQDDAEAAAQVTRICLEGERGRNIRYQDIDEAPADPGPNDPPIVNDSPKPGRNDPCPCGSGKKFKKCCGKSGP